MIARYHVVVGFIDSITESQCEMYDTIVQCIELKVTVPTIGGGHSSETFQLPYERYMELQHIGGIGAKIRITQTENQIVLEKDDFTLCRDCGDVLLFDEILQDYEMCDRRVRSSPKYLSGQCYIIDECVKFGVNSVEFSIGVKGRIYDCFLTKEHACYSFLRTFYEFMRDNRFRNNFHFRGEVDGDKMLLMTFEFDSFH